LTRVPACIEYREAPLMMGSSEPLPKLLSHYCGVRDKIAIPLRIIIGKKARRSVARRLHPVGSAVR